MSVSWDLWRQAYTAAGYVDDEEMDMNNLRQAAQQALDFIVATNKSSQFWLVPESNLNKTVTALKAALAEPRSIQECYGDCPTNPQTCPNPCNFEGRPRPVQEPTGCDHCTHSLYAAIKCRNCGRVTE